MIRRLEVTNPGDAAFTRNVVALNGGRPGEAARAMAGFHEVAGTSSGLSIRQALHWGADTGAAVEEVRRLARTPSPQPPVGGMGRNGPAPRAVRSGHVEAGAAGLSVRRGGDSRAGDARVGGLPVDDSVARG